MRFNLIFPVFLLSISLSACKKSESTATEDSPSQSPPAETVMKYYAYTGSQYANVIYGFSLDKSTGAVTELPFVSIAAQNSPMITAASYDGKYLLAANYSSHSVSSYSINRTDGSLTLVEHQALAGSSSPAWIIAHPSLSVFYTADSGLGQISILDSASGDLSVRGTIAAGSGVTCLAINSSGSVLYALNQNINTISIYSVNGSGGLTYVQDVSTGAGTAPNQMALSPNGNYLYVANWSGNSVSGFTVSGTGLTSMGAAVSAGANVYMVSVSGDGKKLVASLPYNHTFKEFPLDSTTGAIGSYTSQSLTGAVSTFFFKSFAILMRWGNNSTYLPIQTRTYDETNGIGTSATSETGSGYKGLYQMTVVELAE